MGYYHIYINAHLRIYYLEIYLYGYKISKVLIEKNPVVIFFRRINHERFIAIYGFLPTYIEFIRHYRYALLLFGTLQLVYNILYRKHMVVNTF